MTLIEKLRDTAHIVYNQRLPRSGPGVPFDPESERWQREEFACAYDDDPDTAWDGFK